MRRLAAMMLALCSIGCAGPGKYGFQVFEISKTVRGTPNSSGLPLRDGQVILTESADTTSYLFMLLPEHFYDFTHAGIVAIEDGKPVVYEVSGELRTFPLRSRMLDNVVGEVHRRDFYEYVGANLYSEVHDVEDGVDGSKVVAFAREQYRTAVPFDPFFRFDDHSSLFCTELVELSRQAGGATPHILEALNPQPSLTMGLGWLGVLPNKALPAGFFKSKDKLAIAMGQFASRTGAYAYFAAKEEIYRRFRRPDQRLGFLFSLSSGGKLELRPEIGEFTARAAKLFPADTSTAHDDPRVHAEVRALADELWGSYSDEPIY